MIEEAITAGAEAQESEALDLLALHEALKVLKEVDPRQARIVELRFFAGFTIEETADLLGVSATTVKREWRSARLWLHQRLLGAEQRRSRQAIAAVKQPEVTCALFVETSSEIAFRAALSAFRSFLGERWACRCSVQR